MAKVLVIDDEPMVRGVICQALEDEGIAAIEAADGREGLAKFTAHRPPVVVTDLIMPDKEGLETIIALRKMEPKVCIVAISGGGRVCSRDFLEAAKCLGANRIVRKPFDYEVLVAIVKELMAEAATEPA